MKIGFSYSNCLIDIYEGIVDFDDVLLIISGTKFDPENEDNWESIWLGYTDYVWEKYQDFEEEFKELTLNLYHTGKLHQPRLFGARSLRPGYNWIDAILPPRELDKNPSAKKAWDDYQLIAGLSNIKTVTFKKFKNNA